RWVKALVVDREVALRLTVDRPKVLDAVTRLEGDRRTLPKEPTVRATAEEIALVPGEPGIAIDVDEVADALPRTTSDPGRTIVVDAPRVETRPRIADETVAKLAETAMATTAGEITLTWADQSAKIDGTRFRPGFRLVTDADGARLDLDPRLVQEV